MPPDQTSRDLVLAPNQEAYILDETKGNVAVYVGATKVSLSNTDRPVNYSAQTKRYEKTDLERAIHEFPYADEGWYIVLENPAKRPEEDHPKQGSNVVPPLELGRKINVPGPDSFPLWPGQVAHVIQGHHLRSNQYLIVRVYNEEAAKENWNNAIIKPQSGSSEEENRKVDDLTMGKVLIIKGTDVSFYIPPTGIEVIPEIPDHNNYVRDAVTLERLEYCILLDENGNKRFVQGPKVVFPTPTETFVEKVENSNRVRKFRAIELNKDMGVYIKVIADYKDGDGTMREIGEELFITGADQKIYYPRSEHAIVKYGDREIHYAIAIPRGEARYVLNKETGNVGLVRGPSMFLPDPRTQVVVRRVVDPKLIELWYPGNNESLEYNRNLLLLSQNAREESRVGAHILADQMGGVGETLRVRSAHQRDFAGDDFQRGLAYTRPRTITLDTKYDGAVSINVWTGYAVLVVNKAGERKVAVGPETVLLEYDETLAVLVLSKGTPKSDDDLMKTVYLRAQNNKVSDVVRAETKDLVQVSMHVSYRVNFEGDPTKWFNVENYVKFLTDHMRSLLRNVVKRHGVAEFNDKATSIIRDTVLGASEDGKRSGRMFEENGMRIYDVEVLNVEIEDDTISSILVNAQHKGVEEAVALAQRELQLNTTRRTEEIVRETARLKAVTAQKQLRLTAQEITQQQAVDLAQIGAETKAVTARQNAELGQQEDLDKINNARLARAKAERQLDLDVAEMQLTQDLNKIKGEADAVVTKVNALNPAFVAALQAFGDKELAVKVAESLAPVAILSGGSAKGELAKILQGTVLAKMLLAEPSVNGSQPKPENS